MQRIRKWWWRERPRYLGEIDLGGGRSLAAEDVLEGHYRRLASTQQGKQGNRQVATVQIGDNLVAAIGVLAPSLSPLAELAEEVAVAVAPVHPTPQFRRNLHEALELTHRQHSARRILGTHKQSTHRARSVRRYSLVVGVSLLLLSVAVWWQTSLRRSYSSISFAA